MKSRLPAFAFAILLFAGCSSKPAVEDGASLKSFDYKPL